MKPVVEVGGARVFQGDCREVLRGLPDNSVDAVVTDPPYELGFMGKKWDSTGVAYDVNLWMDCFRVLKPGGHVLAFGGSRTWHRLAVAVEDAGFEIRDSIAWLYGSGFPKSLDVSKAIDKAAGAEREKVPATGGLHKNANMNDDNWSKIGDENPVMDSSQAITNEAKQWEGWGTAFKPAHEPVVVGRKPLVGTVAENVLEWGVGGLNIDGSRIASPDNDGKVWVRGGAGVNARSGPKNAQDSAQINGETETVVPHSGGRWPANVILDEHTAGLLDEQSGENPSRFFYQAKASKRDRNEGLEELEARVGENGNKWTDQDYRRGDEKPTTSRKNFHPTVKPTALMRYLIKLVTPPGGTVLDPFTGSGSTGKAALLDGFEFVGVELTEEYLPIIEGRLRWASEQVEETDDTLF